MLFQKKLKKNKHKNDKIKTVQEKLSSYYDGLYDILKDQYEKKYIEKKVRYVPGPERQEAI